MEFFVFTNTGGKKIIWSTSTPSGQIQGYDLKKGDVFIDMTNYIPKIYNGSSFEGAGGDETAVGIYKWSYDATDYVTLTIANNGAATFDHVSGGTAGFVFSDPITLNGALTVGVAGTGHDVQLFGDTSGCSFLWDQSEDQLVLTGPADVPVLKIAGEGSYSAVAWAAVGAAWADTETPAFIADQKFLLIDVAGTTYRIPLWANA